MQRARARRPGGEAAPLRAAATATATAEPLAQALRAAGRMLGERLLPHEIATRLATEVDAAVRAGVSLRLALDLAEDPADATPETSAETPEASAEAAALAREYAELPWETLTLPGEDRPLVLHPSVELHRTVSGLGPTSAMGIPGPLRILAVIASPERGGGELLDYEAELARILDAVEPARRQGRGRAYVRILNWGSREAIHAALKQERFHILHISCHARPGELILETATGEADPVDASTFATKILIRDRGIPLVVLAGCSTALAARGTPSPAGEGEGEGEGAGEGEAQLPALARGLLAHGVPAVLAMTTSVSDLYATELTSRLYAELAGREVVDPLAALSDARRAVEAERAALPESELRAALAEWATSTLYLRGPSLPLYDPAVKVEEITEPVGPLLAGGIVARRVGEFVGRRAELRALLRSLRGERTGVVIHGLGGVGKSTLAAQLVTTAGDDGPGLLVSLTGLVAVDQILLTVADRLHSWCLAHEFPERDVLRALVGELRSGQTAWRRRLDLLAEHLLPRASVTLLLDNAEDVLTPDGPGSGQAFLDGDLGAFLAAWLALPGRAKLVVTSRFPLPVNTATARRLHSHHLGPLSKAESRKLLWRLPALRLLPPADQARAIADVGGHPRTLEYLDALLAGGAARFTDIAGKLEDALHSRGITNPAAWFATTAGDLDRALAEAVTLAVDDILLDDLLARLDGLPHARRLLDGAAVYRLPVDRIGLAWQISDEVERPPLDPTEVSQLTEIATLLRQA
ncbi:CHAT domain-containing protein, partial [Candidatus Frankia nodulisporulans]